MTRVDLLEVGGDGGVFQHSVALAEALSSAYDVRLHTALGHEPVEGMSSLDPTAVCTCFSWLRSARRARGVRISLRYLFRTLPHYVRSADLAWVQGQFKLPLTLLTLVALRLAGRRIVFSPHNVFARHGGRGHDRMLAACLRLAHVVVVYNRADVDRVRARRVVQLPLVFPTPEIGPDVEERWRWVSDEGYAVAALGHIRADKNLPLLVEAADRAGLPLIVMGPDKGALASVEAAAARSGHPVAIRAGFWDVAEIALVAREVGLVALPYQVASQSGVAELALNVGAMVVAADTGGLAERADVVVHSLDVDDWAAALRRAHEQRGSRHVPAAERAAELVEFVREVAR